MSDKIKIDTINNKYLYDKNILLKETINYPIIINANDLTFNDYYLNMVSDWKKKDFSIYKDAISNYNYNKNEGYPFNSYETNYVTNITLNKNNIVSLYIDEYAYTGGAHGNTIRIGNTWDMINNKMLKLSDILTGNYNDIIISSIKKEAHDRALSNKVSYFDDINTNIEKYYDEDNFYLDEIGINIFYPLYTIGPYYIGIQVFNMPYYLFKNRYLD